MGGNSSKPQEPPKSVHPPPIKPWRAIVFNNSNYTSLQKEAAEHKPHPKASTTNILLVGPVGSGKSSFVNSVLSEIGNDEFHNRVRYAAMTRVNAGGTVTRHLRCHIHKNIKIFDTAGWDTENHFITTLRFEQIIDGEVPADTKFSDNSTNNTTVNGARIHCVVFVMSAHSFDSEDSSLLNALEGFIGVLTNKELPYLLLITSIDTETDDLENVYKKADVKIKVEAISNRLKISMCNVMVVSNYFQELKIDCIKGTLLLDAFGQMLMAAKHFQERM